MTNYSNLRLQHDMATYVCVRICFRLNRLYDFRRDSRLKPEYVSVLISKTENPGGILKTEFLRREMRFRRMAPS